VGFVLEGSAVIGRGEAEIFESGKSRMGFLGVAVPLVTKSSTARKEG